MGVYHFMGMGFAVGPVTCAVDYIERCLDMARRGNAPTAVSKLFSGTGGIAHEESEKGKIEAIVLFTSDDVISKGREAYAYRSYPNPGSARIEVENRLRDVWKTYNRSQGRKVFWCEVEIDDFRDCHRKVRLVAQRIVPAKKQGKEIWCNLTSGANPIAHALHSMASLTATSVKNYMISQRKDYRHEWQVPQDIIINPNRDGYWSLVPFIKVLPDESFYQILFELESHSRGITTNELFNRLRASGYFLDLEEDEFRRKILLKLFSLDYTHYDENSKITTITATGKRFMSNEFEHYLDDDFTEAIGPNYNIVEASKNWTWLQEIDLDNPK